MMEMKFFQELDGVMLMKPFYLSAHGLLSSLFPLALTP